MNNFKMLLSKIAKKIHINKFMYYLTLPFVSSSNKEVNLGECRKELDTFWPYRECNIETINKFHPIKYDLQIVVPVYNSGKYITKCIDSIINQKTKYNFLIEIINDGSTDDSYSIIKKYKQYSNVKIVNQNNKGVAYTRNVGIKEIYANYIMFVDSDDFILESCIEQLMCCAYKNNADIVEGGFISNNNGRINKHYMQNGLLGYDKLNGFLWGKVINSKLFTNLSFPNGYIYEDTMPMFLVYPKISKIYGISELVYCHIINSNGIVLSSKYNKRVVDSYWITEILNDYRNKKHYPIDLEYWVILKKQFSMNYHRTCILPKCIKKDIFYLESNMLKCLYKKREDDDKLMKYIYEGDFNHYCHYLFWN